MKELTMDELSVGMEVWYREYVSYGWQRLYSHPAYRKTTVQRITPKRTKAVLENGIETKNDPYCGMSVKLFRLDPEMEKETELAERFRRMKHLFSDVRQFDDCGLAGIPDEKTAEAAECLEKLAEILCGKKSAC